MADMAIDEPAGGQVRQAGQGKTALRVIPIETGLC